MPRWIDPGFRANCLADRAARSGNHARAAALYRRAADAWKDSPPLASLCLLSAKAADILATRSTVSA